MGCFAAKVSNIAKISPLNCNRLPSYAAAAVLSANSATSGEAAAIVDEGYFSILWRREWIIHRLLRCYLGYYLTADWKSFHVLNFPVLPTCQKPIVDKMDTILDKMDMVDKVTSPIIFSLNASLGKCRPLLISQDMGKMEFKTVPPTPPHF